MKNKFLSLIAVACALTYVDCKAQLVVDMTTGSTNGIPLAVGVPDDTWTTVYDPFSTAMTNYVSNGSLWTGGPWTPYAQNTCGQWTSPYTITAAGPSFGYIASGSASGYWEYEMTFMNTSTCPVDVATLNLNVYGADDDLTEIIINGNAPIVVGPAGFGLTGSGAFPVPPGYIVPGVNTIRARVYDFGGWGALFVCGNITINFGTWNNTTSNSLGGDQGNDIITDPNGDVYVAGTYFSATDFTHPTCPAITIPGSPTPSAYIAKYSSCGDLLWVNFDNGTGWTRGTGIAYDPVRNYVYMTGTEDRVDVSFQTTAATPCGPAPVPAPATIAMHYYVAKFDATTGNFIDINHQFIGAAISVKPNVYIDVNNIGPNTTDIYLALTYTDASDERIRLHKIQETGGVYGTTWINTTVPASSPFAKTANDLIYHNFSGRLYLTGTFFKQITFNTTSLVSPALSEAFVWEFNSATGASGAARMLGTPGGFRAEGTSVIEGPSRIFATGYFNRDVANVFGSGFAFAGGPNNYRSYAVSFGGALGVAWANEIRSVAGSDNMATGIGFSTGQSAVVLTGMLTGNITSPGVMVPNGLYITATPGSTKTFMAGYNNIGTPLWSNTAIDNTPGSRHISTKIAADANSTCYSTGGYTNEFDYLMVSVPPASGALFATPPGNLSSYFVRNNIPQLGAFFKTGQPTAEEEIQPAAAAKANSGVIGVYPNPSDGAFTLDLGQSFIQGSEAIEVYDLMGKKVQQINTTPNKTSYDLNLTGQPKGIYFVKMLVNNKVEVQQIQLR